MDNALSCKMENWLEEQMNQWLFKAGEHGKVEAMVTEASPEGLVIIMHTFAFGISAEKYKKTIEKIINTMINGVCTIKNMEYAPYRKTSKTLKVTLDGATTLEELILLYRIAGVSNNLPFLD